MLLKLWSHGLQSYKGKEQNDSMGMYSTHKQVCLWPGCVVKLQFQPLRCFKLHTVPRFTSSKDIRARVMKHPEGVGADPPWRLDDAPAVFSSRPWASGGSWDTPGWGSWRTRGRRWGSSPLCPLSPQSWVTGPGRGTGCCNPGGAQT